jgi:hypothetical protein
MCTGDWSVRFLHYLFRMNFFNIFDYWHMSDTQVHITAI